MSGRVPHYGYRSGEGDGHPAEVADQAVVSERIEDAVWETYVAVVRRAKDVDLNQKQRLHGLEHSTRYGC